MTLNNIHSFCLIHSSCEARLHRTLYYKGTELVLMGGGLISFVCLFACLLVCLLVCWFVGSVRNHTRCWIFLV